MAGIQAGFPLLSLSLGCLHPPICCTIGSCMGWKCILSCPPTEGPDSTPMQKAPFSLLSGNRNPRDPLPQLLGSHLGETIFSSLS